MKLTIIPPAKSLNKAFQKQRITRQQIDHFKTNLIKLFGSINVEESEEHLKNIVADFLKDTYYKDLHYINTKERTDLVIHNGKTPSDSVGVIIEAKRPGNKLEMVSKKEANVKALHELILYYLRNRVDEDNHEIKYLIATNIYEWFIFDAVWFEKNIYRNAKFIKDYEEWKVSGHDTKYFYENIAAKYLEAAEHDLSCTYFNLKEYEQVISDTRKQEDTQLVNLYKILSPEQLLKKPFANDSNSLNKEFYNELLHIVGLYENKDGGKYIIGRKPEKERNEGSLLESTIHNLRVRDRLKQVDNTAQYGETEEEQLFSIALELCLTWLNRILFLKLLEGQLISYHRGDIQYSFLNVKRTSNYDELNELFFEVLALPVEKRSPSVKKKFGDLPYLNSSLFEETLLENSTFVISELKERNEIPVYSGTMLKGTNGKRITGTKNTLHYLFEFLDAYDYSSEGKELIQEENKSIINASVLGLIFEKINGYKDGSYFTPGFITMYMCRETLRKAVVKKFQDSGIKAYQSIQTFDDLKDAIEYTDKEKRAKANDIINSMKVCDPAVGSGHFLVSALNELIAIKSDLRILHTRDELRFQGYKIVVENDELIIVNEETDELFEYTLNKNSKPIEELQTLQEALFHEKQMLIENCLFGVDINPKSVMICRLRLWIELLKNAYYTKESKYQYLETLPNIDINIKCGNSLISRYDVQADLSDIFRNDKNLLSQYRIAVAAYKNSTSKEAKGELQNFINGFKENIINKFYNNHPLNHKLSKYKGQLALVENKAAVGNLFGKLLEKDIETDVKKLKTLIEKTEQEIENVKSNRLYEHAFEWRFEFPEVLDDDGRFLGFDVVIGNPPYIDIKGLESYYVDALFEIYKSTENRINLYSIFIELGYYVMKEGGLFSFINPNSMLMNSSYSKIRSLIFNSLYEVIKLPDNVFSDSDVKVETIIIFFQKGVVNKNADIIRYKHDDQIKSINRELIKRQSKSIWAKFENKFNLYLTNDIQKILLKVAENSVSLVDIADFSLGITPYDKYKGHSETLIEERGFHSNKKLSKEYKPVISGENVQRYYIDTTPQEYLKYGDWLGAPREERFFTKPRIIVRQIISGDPLRIYAGYTEASLYFSQIGFGIITKKNIDPKYLTALLNSTLVNFIHKYLYLDIEKELFQKILIENCKKFPIKLVTQKGQQPFLKLVDKILEKKQKSPTADTTDLEHQIDELVYKIYGLTEEEIKIVEGKNDKSV
ncbi:MAG: TaqI-like C-terminal specificity domain-containing protein [Bacteroidota bacterium]|jgi:adenine-specific DNA-methyltransferase